MQTVTPDDREINRYFPSDTMKIAAVDEGGYLASVEINLFPRWRQAHGFVSFSSMVDAAMDAGVTFCFPDGSADKFTPGGYVLSVNTPDLAALQDPSRATFINMRGQVVELPWHGGRA